MTSRVSRAVMATGRSNLLARKSNDRAAAAQRLCVIWAVACAVSILIVSLVPAPAWPGARREFFTSLAVRAPREWVDVVGNIALYLPLGYLLVAAGVRGWRAWLIGVALSTSAELLQFVVPGRDPSLRDILTNAAGTALGAWVAATSAGQRLIVACVRGERWLDKRLDPFDSSANPMSVAYAIVLAAIAIATAVLELPWAPSDRQYVLANATIDPLPGSVIIGASADGSGTFKGLLDDIRVYARALSEPEIERDGAASASDRSRKGSSLVAAFGFDGDAPGTVETDDSGLHHDGVLDRAAVGSGRHGEAIALDGHGRMIVPDASSFGIHSGVTLEAWVYLDPSSPVESPVIRQERGAYQLGVTADTGVRRVIGGGIFGGSPMSTRSVEPVPVGRWTHVAMTYDGEAIRIFVNGRLDAMRRRWSSHRPADVSLDGRSLPFGAVDRDRRVAPALLGSFVLDTHVTCGSLEQEAAPLLLLTSARNVDPLTLVASGPDILVRRWTIGRVLGLLAPDYQFRGALAGCSDRRRIAVELSGPLKRPRLAVDGRNIAGRGLGIGSAWALFIHSELLPVWLYDAVAVCSIGVLLVPFGYWLRPRSAGAGAVAIAVAALGGVPFLFGIDPLSSSQIAAAIIGTSLGAVAARARVRRSLRAASQDDGLNRFEDDK